MGGGGERGYPVVSVNSILEHEKLDLLKITASRSFGNVAKFKYSGTVITN
jgi:hypothetical protein